MRLWRMIIAGLMICLPLYAQSNEDCLTCHSDPQLTGLNAQGTEISMYVDARTFRKSIHGELDCVDCHEDLRGVEEFPHAEELAPVHCGNCHDDVEAEYSRSMHGLKFVHLEELAPRCWDCHGAHDILPPDDPDSRVYFQNLPNTCCGCHERLSQTKGDTIHPPCIRKDYLMSIHGKAVLEGNDAAPTCNTCHPAHQIRKRIDPQSTTYKLNIPYTCGKCHVDELADYSESIHFSALKHGVLESAACTDCHGEHKIMAPDSAFIYTSHDACITCHNDTKIISKYGLSRTVVSTYEDSYHGLSVRLGQKKAATCARCHGYHDIHAPDNPYSKVNPRNLVQTCSQCHENVTPEFSRSYTHESMLIHSNPVNYYITLIYTILIVGIIGAMLLHNLIIYIKYLKYKQKEEERYYVIRFKTGERIQHCLLMLSFTVLALSGFALRFPDAWWVQAFEKIGILEAQRRIIHRVAAVTMVLVSLYHLYYIIFTPRGRHLFRQIMFRLSDVKEALQSVKYYLGLSHSRPQYDEFDYTEKIEYWALVWGNFVMGLTGFILWFPTLITGFAPPWVVRAAELIHFYEAILATLAILVFHLFFVIAHPEQYPMNLAWYSGKMSLRAAIRKHPRWVERILRERKDLDLLPEVIAQNCKTLSDVDNYLKFGDIYKEMKQGKLY